MRPFSIALVVVLLSSLLSPTLSLPVQADLTPPPPDPLQALNDASDGQVTIEYHSQTGMARFIGALPDHPIHQDLGGDAQSLAADAPAMSFLQQYGSLFGITSPSTELTLTKTSLEDGHTFTRYQQVYQGIPVMGGEINVQTLPKGDVLSANGEFLPGIDLTVQPRISAADAQTAAIQRVVKDGGYSADNLVATQPELWIYDPRIVGGPGLPRTSLAWRVEVTSLELAPLNELVLVDAQAGIILLNFNQVDTALSLATYSANNGTSLPGSFKCDQTDLGCSAGDSHARSAHQYAADTYNFYSSMFGRDSIDNAGMTIRSTVHYDSGYENAFWDGSQMVYGDAYGYPMADDVVAHELSHGVTDYESHLFYYYQSGAINEALSDIFGEMVDQWNGHGTDDSTVKWLLGEDITGLGAIRSMQSPTTYENPDKMTSYYYSCDSNDNGQVHNNSGVANKAAYLIQDGGTFNGQTITGLGLQKSAQIWYRVQRNFLTSGSDYQDLASDLVHACYSLTSQYGITFADCGEVSKAVAAVQMNTQPPSCQTAVPTTCPTGYAMNSLFNDNLENPSSGKWAKSHTVGNIDWSYPQNPNPVSAYGWDMTYATSGVYNMYGFDQENPGDYSISMTQNVALPAGKTAYLLFNHAYSFEGSSYLMFDGGIIEYSLNNGAWQNAGGLIDQGRFYDGTIISGYDNPLGGSAGFGGESKGYVASRLNLASLQGNNIRFRFRIGSDQSNNDYGWYIDDIKVFTCMDTSTLHNHVFLPNVIN